MQTMVHVFRIIRLALIGAGLGLLPMKTSLASDPMLFAPKLTGHGGPIRSISLSGDFKAALTTSFDYSIIVWDFGDGDAKIRHRLSGHNAAVNDADFIPGTNEIISVSDDGSTAIWDIKSGKMLDRLTDTADKVLDLAVSHDGKIAAIARWDGTARLIDLTAHAEIARLEGHRGNVNAVAFSSDDTTIFTGSYDGVIRAFDRASGTLLDPVYAFGWGINVLAPSPDGRTLFFGALDGTVGAIRLVDQTFHEMAKFDRPVLAMVLSPDGTTLATGNGAGFIHLFDAKSLAKKRDAAGSFGPVWGLAFTGNDDTLYHVGLDDFATWHDLGKASKFQPVQSEFPRRFQLSKAESIGELEFNRKCSVCHTLTPDGAHRAGPTLYKIFGREAGTLHGYDYSKALVDSPIIWTEETISELFDKGPDLVVPGTKMPIQRLKSIDRRNELVAFLKKATAPKAALKLTQPVEGQNP